MDVDDGERWNIDNSHIGRIQLEILLFFFVKHN